jgi:hypothetical protein
MTELGVRDLVLAEIEAASGRGDKRAAARLQALRRAFGLHEDDEKQRWDPLENVFADAVRAYRAVGSPFDGYLEAPPEVIRMYRHHGPRISGRAEDLRGALLDLLADLAVARWSLPPSMRVTDEDLLHQGFDPAHFPASELDEW